MKREDISTFDKDASLSIIDRALPHWDQAGTICFITWRLADSLPKQALDQLDQQIREQLAANQLSLTDWTQELAARAPNVRGQIQWQLFQTRDKYLDAGAGKCWLHSPNCATAVLHALQYFDGDRYFLTDAVVMPNHVHFICAFEKGNAMLKQCEDWKRFTARAVNKEVGRTGQLWQVDQFDHLIRSADQFEHYRRYIKNNPSNANLQPTQFLHFSKPLA